MNAATEKQVLTNAAYRDSIIQQGISDAVKAASVPSGPQHTATISALTQQTTSLLNQLFEVVREALETSIHQAFVVTFCLCLVILIVTVFLKDAPTTRKKG